MAKNKTTNKAKTKSSETVVWSRKLESGHYLQVPKVLFKLGRYSPHRKNPKWNLAPRHIVLAQTLMARKFKGKQIRAYWIELAQDLGVSTETVRKWAYQLRDLGLLKIVAHRRRAKDGRPGIRNDSNGFDLSPLVSLLEEADASRKEDQAARRKGTTE